MAGKDRTAPKDINSMTVEEIAAYLENRKEQEVRERHERAVRAKGELESYCQEKYGLTLAEIFTTPEKMPERRQYQHPQTGEVYAYSGRGKVPTWLRGADGKPNTAYEVVKARDLSTSTASHD